MRLDHLSQTSTRAARGCAIALGFSIPVSVALDNLLLAAVLLLWLASGQFREKLAVITDTPVVRAALGLFMLLAVGILWSTHPAEGTHILGKYADLAFVPIFITLFRASEDRRRAGLFLLTALLLTLLLSYLNRAGAVPHGYLVTDPANQPNVFKLYLTQSILMACGAYWLALLAIHARSLRSRLLWVTLAALAIVNVTLMLSGRSGQIILAALAVYLCFSVWRWRGILLATGCGLIGVAVLIFALVSPESGFAGGNIEPASGHRDGRISAVIKDYKAWQQGGASNTSTGQRLDFATNSIAIVSAHPIIGVGTGGFAAAYAQQVDGLGKDATVNPHNEYLNLAVQLGILGLLMPALLFLVVWQQAKGLPSPLERDLARGLAIAFAVGCLFNSMLMDHVEGLLFAWCLGVLFGGYMPPRKPEVITTT